MVVPWFTDAFETFGKFFFANSALGDKHDCGYLSCTNTNVAIFFRIMNQGLGF